MDRHGQSWFVLQQRGIAILANVEYPVGRVYIQSASSGGNNEILKMSTFDGFNEVK